MDVAAEKTAYRARIAQLNDGLRQTFWGGKVMMTPGVQELPEDLQLRLFRAVAEFDNFTVDNDPHGERDFGRIALDGHRFFWKIDYYDRECRYGSENPADANNTTRILTIMLASEY
ncbi:MAG: hypothetical protein DI582_06305 [Azospirillum brasilense]|nr:MAG: hypothetical protein DI582_06305 [Azospirillum brasilense]